MRLHKVISVNVDYIIRRVTRGGGGRSLLPFFENLKKCPNFFGGNALIEVIYGLNFSFKMQFSRVSKRKTQKFFPAGPFFLGLKMIFYRSDLIPRKLPCPKESLVTRVTIIYQFI